jgi:hypothetical protein
MDNVIATAVKNGNGNAILYTAALAAMLANCIPTPADGIYFYTEGVNKSKLDAGTITPKQYWMRDVFGYYFYTAAWYGVVLMVMASMGGSYQNKAKIGLTLVASGIVVGVVFQNIKKDNELQAIKKQQQATNTTVK